MKTFFVILFGISILISGSACAKKNMKDSNNRKSAKPIKLSHFEHENPKCSFDFPEFSNWEAEISEGGGKIKITYLQKDTNYNQKPLPTVTIGEIILDIDLLAPDKYLMNKYGVRYDPFIDEKVLLDRSYTVLPGKGALEIKLQETQPADLDLKLIYNTIVESFRSNVPAVAFSRPNVKLRTPIKNGLTLDSIDGDSYEVNFDPPASFFYKTTKKKNKGTGLSSARAFELTSGELKKIKDLVTKIEQNPGPASLAEVSQGTYCRFRNGEKSCVELGDINTQDEADLWKMLETLANKKLDMNREISL
jgi:hypothetical protein